MTLTINLLTKSVAEVIPVSGPVEAIAELASRNLTPQGEPNRGYLLGTFGAPVGTYSVR